MKRDFYQFDLINQDSLLFRPVLYSKKLSDTEFRTAQRVGQDGHVFVKRGWEASQKLFIHSLQLLQTQEFQADRPTFNNTSQIILLHIKSQNLNKLQHLRIQLLEM